MRSHKELEEAMVSLGATKAEVIPVSGIVLDKVFREICEGNGCGNFGGCWICPPYIGEIEDCMERVRSYSFGLLYQYVGEIEDSFDFEGMGEVGHQHSMLNQRIREVLPELLGEIPYLQLGSGHCGLCERCAKRDDLPCRFPDKAIPSLEGYGINVSATCRDTELKYVNGVNTVTFFGIILF